MRTIALGTMMVALAAAPVSAISIDYQEYSIGFAVGQDEIPSPYLPLVQEAAAFIISVNSQRIVVVGCPDTRGQGHREVSLGERRARRVADKLVSLGVNPRFLSVYGDASATARACEDRHVLIVSDRG